jgi:hypothetical protein
MYPEGEVSITTTTNIARNNVVFGTVATATSTSIAIARAHYQNCLVYLAQPVFEPSYVF